MTGAAFTRLTGALPALLMLLPAGVGAQDVEALAEDCATGIPSVVLLCQDLALATAAVQRAVGLAASLGSDIPGTPSTLGFRVGDTPRIGLSLSPLLVRADLPDVAAADGTGPMGRRAVSLVGLRAGAAVGVVDGFQLAPTVGGVLSVDALATWSWTRLPSEAGFDAHAMGLGLGARVGIVRESFSLPGVSVSVMRHWPGAAQLGSISGGGTGEVDADAALTSLRATVGKNLFAVGFMVGAGWDRYTGDATVAFSVADGLGGIVARTATGSVSTDRRLYFVAGWFNFLISQVSFEAGFAEGFDDPFGVPRTFDASDGTLFLSLGLRVTI